MFLREKLDNKIKNIFKYYTFDSKNQIFVGNNIIRDQKKEILIRSQYLKKTNNISNVGKYHSIQVMHQEVDWIIKSTKKNSLILDIGGGFGWHWIKIIKKRTDLKIFIIDMVLENLLIARKIFKKNINKNIFLINENVCSIKIKNKFDIAWSVQTTQHIPNLDLAIKNIHKSLKSDGIFYNYILNSENLLNKISIILKFLKLYKKKKNLFYFNNNLFLHKSKTFKYFKNIIFKKYNEFLFHPLIKFIFSGHENSFLGSLDAKLPRNFLFAKYIARQVCLITKK